VRVHAITLMLVSENQPRDGRARHVIGYGDACLEMTAIGDIPYCPLGPVYFLRGRLLWCLQHGQGEACRSSTQNIGIRT
jgi:hypothetical protein